MGTLVFTRQAAQEAVGDPKKLSLWSGTVTRQRNGLSSFHITERARAARTDCAAWGRRVFGRVLGAKASLRSGIIEKVRSSAVRPRRPRKCDPRCRSTRSPAGTIHRRRQQSPPEAHQSSALFNAGGK